MLDDGVGPITVVDDLSTGSPANLEGLELELVEGTVVDPTTFNPSAWSVPAR